MAKTKPRPSLLARAFFAMKLRAAQMRMLMQRPMPGVFDPHREARESLRRERRRWGGRGGWLGGTGKRQSERITRQIASGQLRVENGLVRAPRWARLRGRA